MDHIVCCFPVEVKVRGLDSKLFQALMCMKKNSSFSALIGLVYSVDKAMFELGYPFIYFAKGINNDARFMQLYKDIKNCGSKLVYMDAEGGPSYKNPENLLVRYNEEALEYVDLIFAWGTVQKDIILSHRKKLHEHSIIVTGNPMFDLKKPDFYEYFKGLRKPGYRHHAGYLLFNLNFSYANTHYTQEQFYMYLNELYERRMYSKLDRKMFDEFCKFQEKMLKSYVLTIKQIAKKFPLQNIVVRPHPSEEENTYIKEFKSINNIVVTKEGSAHEWIIDASMVVHMDCTTAVEAFFYGKIPVSYIPVKYDSEMANNYLNQVPMDISLKANNESELLNIIQDNIAHKKHTFSDSEIDRKKNIVRSVFANIDFCSAELIAEKTNEIAETIDNFHPVNKSIRNTEKKAEAAIMENKMIHSLKSILRPAYHKARRYGSELFRQGRDINRTYAQNVALREKAKFPGLELEEIETRVQLFRKLDPQIPEVKVVPVTKDTYHIVRI